jgi:hypothetical protein
MTDSIRIPADFEPHARTIMAWAVMRSLHLDKDSYSSVVAKLRYGRLLDRFTALGTAKHLDYELYENDI